VRRSRVLRRDREWGCPTGQCVFGRLGAISILGQTVGGVTVFETLAFTAFTAFASAVLVPAPGVVGVLGVAGLVVTRRRR